jgi:hypothetical protein
MPPSGDVAVDRNCLDTAKARADDRRGVTTATLALFAGALSVFGAVYTARTFRLNRQGADRRHQLELAAHKLDHDRHLSERFTRAIEQLGSPALDVRRGGIYALERIARDSAADHPQVVEALSAYVRDHAAWLDPDPAEGAKIRPPSDIQAAITVLGRRDVSRDAEDSQLRLSGVDLRGASLRAGHFEGARLRRAHLEGAHLEGVHLQGAKLRGAQFQGADLGPDADLDLPGANLEGASMPGANFDDAKLRDARLAGVEYDAKTIWPSNFDFKTAVRPRDGEGTTPE